MPTRHVIKQGECLNSVADQYGFFPDTIWDHPDNAELKQRRKNPGVLDAGDELVVPDKELKTVSVATGKVHRFVRRGVPARFHLQVLEQGKAQADVPWVLDTGRGAVHGKTDAEGWIRADVPPGIRRAKLLLGAGEEQQTLEISFGSLDPEDTIEGVQSRLKNLGFDCDVTGTLDERTAHCLELFQEQFEHPEPSGELDDLTRAKLFAAHGGT